MTLTASRFLGHDQESFRRHVRGVLASEIAPHARLWEARGEIPRAAWRALAREGLLGLHHSPAVGGGGHDFLRSAVFLEELGRVGFGGVRFAVALHAYMASPYFALAGSADLIRRFLQPAVAGETIVSLAITEPASGSDLSALAATAVRDGADYVLDGEKVFVVNGGFADVFIIAARTEGAPGSRGQAGISLFVVERDRAGLRVDPNDCAVWRACAISDLSLESVRVPVANLIGRPGSGFMLIMRQMQMERLAAGLIAIGDAANCLATTWRYLSGRHAFGGTLSDQQVVRHRMADLFTEVEAARQLAYHAAWRFSQDPLAITECSMVKLKAVEVGKTVAETCQHLHGAEGYRAGSDLVRTVQDARAAAVAGGASEIMRDIIAQSGLVEGGGATNA